MSRFPQVILLRCVCSVSLIERRGAGVVLGWLTLLRTPACNHDRQRVLQVQLPARPGRQQMTTQEPTGTHILALDLGDPDSFWAWFHRGLAPEAVGIFGVRV